MRSDAMTDQAEGLRRLLRRSATRVIAVTAARPGLGATSLIINLAASMAREGRRVLVLDENISHDNVSHTWALKSRHDLLHAVRRDCTLHDILLQPAQGVKILPMARAMQALPELNLLERESLMKCLAASARDADVVLVDAAAGEQRFISACLAPEQPLLLVMGTSASVITESYALIKRIALEDGRRNFSIVVGKSRDTRDTQTAFDNVAQLAQRQLGVQVAYLGRVPFDERMQHAAQLRRPVVELFPDGAAAQLLAKMGRGLLLPTASGEFGSGEASERAGEFTHVVRRLVHPGRANNMVLAMNAALSR